MTSAIKNVILFAMVLALGGPGSAHAGLIIPASVTAAGSFTGNPSVIIDGVFAPRTTPYNDPRSVSWSDPATSFTIDFGSIKAVGNLTINADNNDDYHIQYSTDGVNYTNLFTFLGSDGSVAPFQGGLDILTTDSSYPSSVQFPGDSTTPEYVGRGFNPVSARYLKLTASVALVNGDSLFGVAELDAYTPSVPEPSSLILTGIAGLTGLAFHACKRRKAGAR